MLVVVGDFEGLKLKYMLIGGEGLLFVVVDKLLKLFKEVGIVLCLINVYGLIEMCVDVFVYLVIFENVV